MSPNVGNFVHDLVEMAKAMETLPLREAEIRDLRTTLDEAQAHNQGLEQNIVNYKQTIEELNAKVRSLEVERDDASFRVLEAEDREYNVLAMAKAARVSLDQMTKLLDPPKPEPQPIPTPEGQSVMDPTSSQTDYSKDTLWGSSVHDAVHSVEEVSQGQSESSPTNPTDVALTSDPSAQQPATAQEQAATSSVDPGPALGPYFGKRYHDQPDYISYHDWMEGGGTDKDYFGRASD